METGEFASLRGNVCVVTGASSGIGRAIAVEFSKAGGNLWLTCRKSTDQLQETAQICRSNGAEVVEITADLGTKEGRDQLIAQICTQSEQPVPTVWVNNAGVDLLTTEEKHLDYSQKLQRLWEVDVTASVELSKHVGQLMKQHGNGVIINIGWDQADRGMDGNSGELFATAKNAVMGFTRSLAVSLAPEVRVNCVAPGWIRTAWGETASDEWQQRVLAETPLKRWGTPEDIAAVVRFLCSDEASYMTGQVINVNGGAIR
ncbi:SDR family NAD(P)-dependent oxidoreductase [Calycomorphotria hydatis]|uniref:3-oxoacyl-[acyl-carrier-protein] reductase FabG n=1 Tax=Calycomorphotria hydatis TaxID=2528027 RepID=A0A517TCX2_9PLAN|nr:SDR family oxidoreductase [Calycomorphotria hydatis]QDT66217.1 3-oxoacyl-[acyl-carrier-protein] reductase FabG [Calycomorphotria hydatis]